MQSGMEGKGQQQQKSQTNLKGSKRPDTQGLQVKRLSFTGKERLPRTRERNRDAVFDHRTVCVTQFAD